MGQKNSQTFNLDIKNFKEVYDYCYLNQIVDMNSFVTKCFKQGFDIQKYGMLGETNKVKEIIKEVEKIVEVPVEKIVETVKEVEVIKYVDREVVKEVPVEKVVSKIEYIYDKSEPQIIEKEVIKEVPIEKVVERIVKISDDTQINELLLKIQQLESRPPEIVEVVKEVPVEVSEDKSKLLQTTLLNLRKELSLKNEKIKELENKITELEKIKINQGAVFLKGSNLTQNL